MNAKDISAYLSILVDLGFVEKEHSILDKKRVRGTYKMKDNFFAFWFKFVSGHFSEIETWNSEPAWQYFANNFNSHLGVVFEKAAKEFLIRKKPFKFQSIGRWWHKNNEIDIVALNEETKEIGFFEVKWSNISIKKAKDILAELKVKSVEVDWNTQKRKEYFGIVAREIEDKEVLRKDGFLVFDLNDFKI